MDFILAILTQCIPFLPLALGISISYYLLRATDMTIDGSFVLGAAIFARLLTLGISPVLACISALIAGIFAGFLTASIQRNGKVDALLAGVLATFILSSINLLIMGKPNINLITTKTLLSSAFATSDFQGAFVAGLYAFSFCAFICLILSSRLGLTLRALGDNPNLLSRLGKNIEIYRIIGFAITNMLAAASGCLSAQVVGYADINMGFGMTLTGIGAIILGRQIFQTISKNHFRISAEFLACFIGVITYFFALNILLRFDINPIYLKMSLGIVLIIFLRTAKSIVPGVTS